MIKLIFIIIIILSCNNDNKEPFSLTEKTDKKWRDYIIPTKEDLAWTGIPWRTSFQELLIEAGEQHKPLLLWVMNGHPLGCT